MESLKLKCTPVLLPTNSSFWNSEIAYLQATENKLPSSMQEGYGLFMNENKKLEYRNDLNYNTSKKQNLYLVSKSKSNKNPTGREIKPGDFYIHTGISPNTGEYKTVNECGRGLHTSEVYDSLINPTYDKDQLFIDGMFAEDCEKIEATTDQSLKLPLIPHTLLQIFPYNESYIKGVFNLDLIKSSLNNCNSSSNELVVKTNKDNECYASIVKYSFSKEELLEVATSVEEYLIGHVKGKELITEWFNEWFDNKY
jgi:hypothetical protein